MKICECCEGTGKLGFQREICWACNGEGRFKTVPEECYKIYGKDLDGCSTQENEGCIRCVLYK